MKTNQTPTSRRNFLKSTLALPVALAATPSLLAQRALAADAPAPVDGTPLPRRQLGKNGPQVTQLAMGVTMGALSLDFIDLAWSMGIRYFDTAPSYLNGKSEKTLAQWLAKYPERRKEIFLVTKAGPKQSPEGLLEMVDLRIAACGTTYTDALYIHGLGPQEYGEESLNWPKGDAFKKTAEALKKSGKVKLVGFSCHDGRLPDYLNAAAEGGFLDVVMIAFNPFYPKGGPLDKAIDAAHQAGLGVVAMKTMRNTNDVPKRLPEFDKLGLTTHQAVLHAVWSDPRIASIVHMPENVDQLQLNCAAARSYKAPLKFAHLELLKETIIAGRRTLCTGCPACEEFARQTRFAFHDISRFVTYYEQDGNTDARNYYQALPLPARDSASVNLAALRDSCHFKTDYPEIIRRAEHYFA